MPIWRVLDSVSTGMITCMARSDCSLSANRKRLKDQGLSRKLDEEGCQFGNRCACLEHAVLLESAVDRAPGDAESARGGLLVVLVEGEGAQDEILLDIGE